MKILPHYDTYRQGRIAGYVTKTLILAIDLGLALFAFFTALLITGNFDFVRAGYFLLGWASFLLILFRGISFVFFKTYLIIIRYVGQKDITNIFLAVTTSSLAFLLFAWLDPRLLPEGETAAIVLTDYLVLLVLTGGFRMLLRLIVDELRMRSNSRINTVVFGAGEMGALLENVLRQNVTHNYRVVAYFDDNPHVHKKLLNGIRVYNPKKSFEEVIKRYKVKVAIIAIKQLPEERRVAFIANCLDKNIKVLKVPATELWFNNTLQVTQLRDINFEDLLNRPPIQLDEEAISRTVRSKVVLVTGCAGSIGREILRQLLKYEPRQIIGVDQAETPLAEITLELQESVNTGSFLPIIGDVRDRQKMRRIFKKYHPEYVFHAAAYKHVPIMERFPEEAVRVNVEGSCLIADLASEFDAEKFVMISTDKVVNPSNVMGASKRIAEIYVQTLNYAPHNRTQFITTRFGNVLGSNGSVIPIFKRQIENRESVTVTHPDITRYFMTIPEACQLVLEAGAMGKGGEIFVFDMGKPVRILDLAKQMIKMAGLVPDLDIKISFSGLRPGEKLYEELLDDQENLGDTHHPKIFRARVRDFQYEEVQVLVSELCEKLLRNHSSMDLVRSMKAIVPEFSSQNSHFTLLDEEQKTNTHQPNGKQ